MPQTSEYIGDKDMRMFTTTLLAGMVALSTPSYSQFSGGSSTAGATSVSELKNQAGANSERLGGCLAGPISSSVPDDLGARR